MPWDPNSVKCCFVPWQSRELLASYKTAFLVQGTPPGKDFHDQLLILEKKAFLKGYHITVHRRLKCIWMAVMAAGVTPEILAACPSDNGLILLSFSLTSLDSP